MWTIMIVIYLIYVDSFTHFTPLSFRERCPSFLKKYK